MSFTINKKFYITCAVGFVSLSLISFIIWISQATQTRHPVVSSVLGKQSDKQELINSLVSGSTVSLKKIKSANWVVPLSGLINLDSPEAKQAGLEDHQEEIEIYAFHINHPLYGDFLIDTGVSNQFFNDPQSLGFPSWLEPKLNLDKMELLTAMDNYLEEENLKLKGVFLSHLHFDHISGISAIDKQVPVYVGRGETKEKYFLYAAFRGAVDTMLEGRPPLQEWTAEYVDIFGDGSLFAIHTPGHTAGSTAYFVNTTEGPLLLTGDATHTAWGWNHGVEPGGFSTDREGSHDSLHKLIQLVNENPEIKVQPGHQSL